MLRITTPSEKKLLYFLSFVGEKQSINITDLNQPHVYKVDSPGANYMVAVGAVSANGKSLEETKVIFVPGDGESGNELF